MQQKKYDDPSNSLKFIDEFITKSEEGKNKAFEKDQSLSDKQLKDVNGGISDLPPWITPTLPEDC